MTRRQDPSIEQGAEPPRRPDVAPHFSAPQRSPHFSRSPRSGYTGFRLIVTFGALILLILAGTLVWQHSLEGTPTVPLNTDSARHGAFVSPPLNAQQINDLHHLATH